MDEEEKTMSSNIRSYSINMQPIIEEKIPIEFEIKNDITEQDKNHSRFAELHNMRVSQLKKLLKQYITSNDTLSKKDISKHYNYKTFTEKKQFVDAIIKYEQQYISNNQVTSQNINNKVYSVEGDTIHKTIRDVGYVKTYLENFLPPQLSLSILLSFLMLLLSTGYNFYFIANNVYVLYTIEGNANYDKIYLQIGNYIVVWIELGGLVVLVAAIIISSVFNYKCMAIDFMKAICSWSSFKLFYYFQPKHLLDFCSISISHHKSRLNETNNNKYKTFKILKHKIEKRMKNDQDHDNKSNQKTLSRLNSIIEGYEESIHVHQQLSQIKHSEDHFYCICFNELKAINGHNKECTVCAKQNQVLYSCDRTVNVHDNGYYLCEECGRKESNVSRIETFYQQIPGFHTIHKETCTRRMLNIAAFLVFFLIILALLGIGMASLALKLAQFKYLNSIEFTEWGRQEWVTFLGFCNQLWNMCNIESIKTETIYRFIFMKQNAKYTRYISNKISILDAVIKETLWDKYGIRGIIFAIMMDSDFLHKIIVKDDDDVSLKQLISYKKDIEDGKYCDLDEIDKDFNEKEIDEILSEQKNIYNVSTKAKWLVSTVAHNRLLLRTIVDDKETPLIINNNNSKKKGKETGFSDFKEKISKMFDCIYKYIKNKMREIMLKRKQQAMLPEIVAESQILRYQQKRDSKAPNNLFKVKRDGIDANVKLQSYSSSDLLQYETEEVQVNVNFFSNVALFFEKVEWCIKRGLLVLISLTFIASFVFSILSVNVADNNDTCLDDTYFGLTLFYLISSSCFLISISGLILLSDKIRKICFSLISISAVCIVTAALPLSICIWKHKNDTNGIIFDVFMILVSIFFDIILSVPIVVTIAYPIYVLSILCLTIVFFSHLIVFVCLPFWMIIYLWVIVDTIQTTSNIMISISMVGLLMLMVWYYSFGIWFWVVKYYGSTICKQRFRKIIRINEVLNFISFVILYLVLTGFWFVVCLEHRFQLFGLWVLFLGYSVIFLWILMKLIISNKQDHFKALWKIINWTEAYVAYFKGIYQLFICNRTAPFLSFIFMFMGIQDF